MQEEIFRFGVIRNPKKLETEELDLISIKIEYDKNNPQPGMRIIKDLADPKAQIKDIIDKRNKNLIFFREADFVGQNKELFKFSKKFETITSIHEIMQTNVLDALPAIKLEVKRKIEDSIVYGAIADFQELSWNRCLRSLYRAIHIIEKVTTDNTLKKNPKAISKLLNAIILLPKEIFPLPNKNKEKNTKNKTVEKAYKSKVTAIKNAHNEKIENYSKAIEEISSKHEQFLSNVKNGERKRFKSLNNLPSSYVNDNVKKFVNKELGIKNIEHADAPEVVSKMEFKKAELGFKLQPSVPFLFLVDGFYLIPGSGPCNTVEIIEKRDNASLVNDLQGYVEFLGILDLKKVKQELLSYEPGELAHIENVLKGESKSKTHRKLDRIEETIFQETERTEEVEQNLQTTDRYELQKESENTINQETTKEAGINITADYGRVKLEAHGNYGSTKSQSSSQRSSSNYAKEVVSKSVQKIKERILNRRSTTTINELEITNNHKINNKDGGDHVVGKYHWLNKYYKAQIVNYGERAILSFMIPEPAAFYKMAKNEKPLSNQIEPPEIPALCDNGKTIPLTPKYITESRYMYWVGKYNVADIEPPPPLYKIIPGNLNLTVNSKDHKPDGLTKESIIGIPSGYKAEYCKYSLAAGYGQRDVVGEQNSNLTLKVSCGNEIIESIDISESASTWDPISKIDNIGAEFQLNKENEGDITLSIGISTDINAVVLLNVVVYNKRTENAYTEWQINTYNSIIEAYKGLQLEYEENLEQQEFTTDINIQGQNPLINRQVEATELKRQAISIMSGQHFEAFNAMEVDYSKDGIHRYPQLNFEDAEIEGKFVRFYEQSFEWQNIVYNFYPYFWGRKEEWINTLNLKDNDPLFEQFLKAGYAKVEVPIRPGYENEVFERVTVSTNFGTEADTSTLPDNDEAENYLSVFTEVIESLGHDFGEQPPGTISIDHETKIVTGTDTNFTDDLVDREIIIDLRSYRIRKVSSETELTLDRLYRSEKTVPAEQNLDNVGFWLGPKFEGEPWLVEVPTSLVILS